MDQGRDEMTNQVEGGVKGVASQVFSQKGPRSHGEEFCGDRNKRERNTCVM